MKTVDVLKQARQNIVEYGWIQGQYRTDEGYCALGAIEDVPVGDQTRLGAIGALLNQVPVTFGGVAIYNDAEGRTKEDILGLFDRAIEAES